MGVLSQKTEYRDFAYVMQDVGSIFLGCKFTYEQLLSHPDVNFKLKTVIRKYLLEELSPDTSLESHFFFMKETDPAAEAYAQLKAKLRVSCIDEKNSKDGTLRYTEKEYPVSELVKLSPEEKEKMGMVIRELVLSKLALFAFAV